MWMGMISASATTVVAMALVTGVVWAVLQELVEAVVEVRTR